MANPFPQIGPFDGIVTLLVLVLVLFALRHRSHHFLRAAWRTYRRYLPVIALFLVVGIFACGFLGKLLDHREESAVINAIRMLKMDAAENTPNIAGDFGHGAAILLWVMFGIELNRVLLYGAIQAKQLRRETDHVIVCGLGSIGIQLVRDLHAARQRTVVVEVDESNRYLDDARELGAIVLVRDAADDETMKLVRPEKARQLFAVTGSDLNNAAVVAMAGKMLQEHEQRLRGRRLKSARAPVDTDQNNGAEIDRSKASIRESEQNGRFGKKALLQCFAHVDSADLAQATNQLCAGMGFVEMEFVTAQDLAASHVLAGPMLDHLPYPLNGRTPHFVLFGFGKQGQALAKQIGELVHLENLNRCRLTILFEDAASVEQFRSEYPAFTCDLSDYTPTGPKGWDLPARADQWGNKMFQAKTHRRSPVGEQGISFACNADWVPMQPNPVNDDALQGIEYLLQRADALPMIFVCTEDEGRNARIGQRLEQSISVLRELPHGHPWSAGVPVFVSLPRHAVLHDAISKHENAVRNAPHRDDAAANTADERPYERHLPVTLVPFARTNVILSYEAIASSDRRALAAKINAFYAGENKETPEQLWARLPYWERLSNLAAAAHAPFKGRILGIPIRFFDNCAGSAAATGKGSKAAAHRDPQNEPVPESSKEKRDDTGGTTSQRLETVAIAEHNRWMAERLLADWRYNNPPANPGVTKRDHKDHMKLRRERAAIAPWDDLPEYEKQKDTRQLEAMLEFFGLSPELAQTKEAMPPTETDSNQLDHVLK